MISPLVPIYDDTREYGFGLSDFDDLPSNRNVMADQHYENLPTKNIITTANVALTMNFTPWLNSRQAMHTEVSTNVRLIILRPMLPTQKPNVTILFHSETTGYWEEQCMGKCIKF